VPQTRPINVAANIVEEVLPTVTDAADPAEPAGEAYAGEPSSDSASEDESASSSSDDSVSDLDDEDIFAGKRGVMESKRAIFLHQKLKRETKLIRLKQRRAKSLLRILRVNNNTEFGRKRPKVVKHFVSRIRELLGHF
jgi:hypothetical protein